MYLYLKKNEATEIVIPTIDTADHDVFKSGISPVDTAYYKDGAGAWTSLAIADTFTEVSTTGVFEISLTAAEMNHDWTFIKVSASGMSDTLIVIKTYTSDIDDVYSRIGAPTGASIAADIVTRAPAGEYDTEMGYIPPNLVDVPTADELNTAHGAGSWEGIPGSTDWSSDEREQIRDALGVDGDKEKSVGGVMQKLKKLLEAILGAAG